MIAVAVRLGFVLLIGALIVACTHEQDDSQPAESLTLAADCAIRTGCVAGDGGIQVTARFEAEPRALQPFPVSLKVEGRNTVREVFVTFGMRDMDMGMNRYRLVATDTGTWRGDVTLPVCISGRSDWVAEFEIRLQGRRIRLQVPFVLSR